nr:hypothetical protein [uncultured Flavobacterium sp.]
MNKINFSLEYLKKNCVDSKLININEDWKSFKKSSCQYVYFIIWNERDEIFSWGTTSGISDRIRKSSLLNDKLTGKYDRRVDYLMLKIIYGNPKIIVFEMPQKATEYELYLKNHFSQLHCWNGLPGRDRNEISNGIIQKFKETNHFTSLPVTVQVEFENYLKNVFFAKRVHPKNPKRTFYWGDSLEPNFLPIIGYSHYENVIEKVLKVKFY